MLFRRRDERPRVSRARRNPLILALALVAFGDSATAVQAQSSVDAVVSGALDRTVMKVGTFAGTGAIGNLDGPASAASFTQPGALLWDARKNTLYVSDLAGQRIRAIARADVTTVAGGGRLDVATSTVAGGYVDGPAATARFDGPLGMALDGSGALLVADSANGVVRRIANGRVSTFAGIRGNGEGVDGPRGIGTLHHPMALAFASDGSLYVADLGIGLRRIAVDGAISTVAKAPDVTCVSVGKGAKREVAWFGTFGGLHRLDLTTMNEEGRGDSDPSSTKARLGKPFQIQAIDDQSVIFSDLAGNTIRYYDESDGYVSAINSDDTQNASESGMFKNGASFDAKADAPMGVAVLPGDRVAFADSGDGRVRTISNVSTRGYYTDDVANVPSKADPATVRIAVVGDSYAFTNVMWNDSISGMLQNGLDASTPPPGKKRFVVDAFRLGGTRLDHQAEFVTNYLAAYDVVILLSSDFSSGGYDKLDKAQFVAPDYPALTATLKATARMMNDDGRFLEIMTVPVAFEASPWERSLARVENFTFETRFDDYARLVTAVKASGVPTIDADVGIQRLERLPDRRELYSPEDWHFNRAGNVAVGEILLRSLLSSKPWLAHR